MLGISAEFKNLYHKMLRTETRKKYGFHFQIVDNAIDRAKGFNDEDHTISFTAAIIILHFQRNRTINRSNRWNVYAF